MSLKLNTNNLPLLPSVGRIDVFITSAIIHCFRGGRRHAHNSDLVSKRHNFLFCQSSSFLLFNREQNRDQGGDRLNHKVLRIGARSAEILIRSNVRLGTVSGPAAVERLVCEEFSQLVK